MKTIKFSPNDWRKIPAKGIEMKGSARVRLEEPATLMVGGVPVGYGTDFNVTFEGAEIVYAPKGWIMIRPQPTADTYGAPLTNFDKRPGEGTAEAMVRRSIREAEITEALRRKARLDAAREQQRQRIEAGLQTEETVPAEPVPQPPVDTGPPETTPEPANPPAE